MSKLYFLMLILVIKMSYMSKTFLNLPNSRCMCKKKLRKPVFTDIDDIKSKIAFAKKIVVDEKEPFKTEAFKIILSKSLDSSVYAHVAQSSEESTVGELASLDAKKNELAEKCSLSKQELEVVFSFHKNSVKLVVPISGKDYFKRLIASQCFLIASEIVLGKDWIDSRELAENLREIGVKDLANTAPHLKKYPEIFRIDAKRGHNKYKLTSGIGRSSAFEIIRKLAKGESLEN